MDMVIPLIFVDPKKFEAPVVPVNGGEGGLAQEQIGLRLDQIFPLHRQANIHSFFDVNLIDTFQSCHHNLLRVAAVGCYLVGFAVTH
jgi:hypothetical protein